MDKTKLLPSFFFVSKESKVCITCLPRDLILVPRARMVYLFLLYTHTAYRKIHTTTRFIIIIQYQEEERAHSFANDRGGHREKERHLTRSWRRTEKSRL